MDLRGIDPNTKSFYCVKLCIWSLAGKHIENVIRYSICTLSELDQLARQVWEENHPNLPREIHLYYENERLPFRRGNNFRNFQRDTPIPTIRKPTITRTWNEPDLS